LRRVLRVSWLVSFQEGAADMAMSSGVVSDDRKPSAEAIALGSLIRDLRLAHGWSQGRLVSALEAASGMRLSRGSGSHRLQGR
jgi:hypothetical protein